jgi:HEAT repeat protein
MSPFPRNHKSNRKERPLPVKLSQNILFAATFATLTFCTFAMAQDAAPAAPAIEDADEPTLIAIVQGDAPYVDKLKACRGLRIRGTAAAVPALAAMLSDPELSHVARYALEPMPFPEAGKALRDALAITAGKPKAGIAASLGVRRDPEAVPVLTPLLNDANADVAQAAAAGRTGDSMLPALLDAMKEADADASVALLHVIARIGNQQALDTVLDALKSEKNPVREEAVRVLSDWPTLDAAPHLLELAKSDDLSRQVLGLRGYVRLVGIEPSPENKIKMLNDAMALAKRPEEKKVVVGAWAAVFATQSLDALRPALDDPDVQNEAAAAILAVATEIAKNPAAKSAAADALNLLIQKSPDAQTKEKAQNALAAIQ